MADTIKDFLVSIGWQVNKTESDNFVNTIERATLRAKLLGDAIEDMARRAAEAIANVAVAFDRLYFASERTGATVSTIRDVGYAVKQLGGSAEGAQASLETMGQKLRENPGNIAYINALGFGFNKINGNLEVQHDLLAKLQAMPTSQAELYRQAVGMDERTFLALRDPQYEKKQKESEDFRKRLGFDPIQASKDANAFMETWRHVSMQVGNIADDVFTKLMRALDGPLTHLSVFIDKHAPEIDRAVTKIADAVGILAVKFDEWFENVDWDQVGVNLKAFAVSFSKATDAVGGLTNAFEILFALWAGGKFVGALASMARLVAVLGPLVEMAALLGLGYGAYKVAEFGAKGGIDASPPGTAGAIGAIGSDGGDGSGGGGGITGWWKRNAPTWLGGNPADAGAGGGDAAPASGAAADRARWLAGKFQSELGLTKEQATGAVGWMLYESGGKLDPTARGPGGDTGIAQWVGTRKGQLLARGPLSLDSNWAQIKYELTEGAYKRVLPRLRSAKSQDEALYAWGEGYEGAGGTPLGMAEEYRRHRPWGDKAAKMLAGAPFAAPADKSDNYAGLNILAGHGATKGGSAQPGLIDVARMLQKSDPSVGFTALNDGAHVLGLGSGPYGAHGQGRAFDAVMKNIEADKQIIRDRLATLGFAEGKWGTSDGDYSIEPGDGGGTGSHLHFQWNNSTAASRFHTALSPKSPIAESARVPDWAKASPRASAGSPYGGLDPHTFDKPLGTGGGTGDTSIHAPVTNNFHIDGANDPSIVAHMVAANQRHVNSDMTSKLVGAMN